MSSWHSSLLGSTEPPACDRTLLEAFYLSMVGSLATSHFHTVNRYLSTRSQGNRKPSCHYCGNWELDPSTVPFKHSEALQGQQSLVKLTTNMDLIYPKCVHPQKAAPRAKKNMQTWSGAKKQFSFKIIVQYSPRGPGKSCLGSSARLHPSFILIKLQTLWK